MHSIINLDKIDHLAIAVEDLNKAISYYADHMGFKLNTIRNTQGKYSGMRSAVMFNGEFSVVLLASLTEGSQIDLYLKSYGPGVQHVAFCVDDLDSVYTKMKANGVVFSTGIINGQGLRQVFTKRDPNTGMMHEVIERTNQHDFDEDSVNQLFEQLEANDNY